MAVECFEESGQIRFRTRAKERDKVVLDLGVLEVK
jgi:hypothetical protein